MHLERLQIPGVDAQQIRLAERRRLELALLVNFAEHRHLQLAGERSELLEQRGRRGCGDEQHRVGAKSARLVDLEDADDEVLAQDRQRDCRAGGAQILERTAEMNAVRQDRKTGRAAALESLAELRGIELRIDRAARRAGALHLGDERIARRLQEPRLERADIVERLRQRRLAPLLQIGDGLLDQLLQMGHGFAVPPPAGCGTARACEDFTSRSSRSSAAPLSMFFAASETPSATSSQTPAAASAAPALSRTAWRRAPSSPRRTPRSMSAFWAGSPPLSASSGARFTPTCSGRISNSRTFVPHTSATRVGPLVEISSRPPSPWTTKARSQPSSARVRAMIGTRCAE